MPLFEYHVRNQSGQLERGVRESSSSSELGSILMQENLIPVEVREIILTKSLWQQIKELYFRSVHAEELTLFARHMHTLCEADVPLALSLQEMAKQTRSPALADCLPKIVDRIEQGISLSQSLAFFPDAFPPLAVHIIKIGEDSGRLAKAFLDLHEYLKFEQANRKQIEGTLRYPIFILSAILIVIGILNIFIIPNFAKFYGNTGLKLPWQTILLMNTSDFFIHYGWYILILGSIGIYLIWRYLKTESGGMAWGKWQLRIPVVGDIIKKILLIRISHSLGVMLSAGISIVPALRLIKPVASNQYIAKQINELRDRIERGVPLIEAMKVVSLFSSVEILMLNVGERKGELQTALHYIASLHSQELPYDLKRLNEFISLALTFLVALLILIVALGVYLPIWNMIDLAKPH